MNLLIIKPEEFIDGGRALALGSRALHIYEYHDLKPGLTIKAGVLNGKLGKAQVLEVSRERIELIFTPESDPLPALPVHAMVAVPRPQSIKKIVQLSAMMGFAALHFFRSAKVQNSYLASKSLRQEAIDEQLIMGLEQAGNSVLPRVKVCDTFLNLEPEKDGVRLLGDTSPEAPPLSSFRKIGLEERIYLAVGPEGGFTQSEKEKLASLDFLPVSLGPRLLRVEVALSVFAAQTSMLRIGKE